jgi:hypothetical protein
MIKRKRKSLKTILLIQVQPKLLLMKTQKPQKIKHLLQQCLKVVMAVKQVKNQKK